MSSAWPATGPVAVGDHFWWEGAVVLVREVRADDVVVECWEQCPPDGPFHEEIPISACGKRWRSDEEFVDDNGEPETYRYNCATCPKACIVRPREPRICLWCKGEAA